MKEKNNKPLTQEKLTLNDRVNALIRQAQTGSRDAGAALIRQYTPLIRAMAAKYMKHCADSADAVNTLTLRALELIRDYRPDENVMSFGAYLKHYLFYDCLNSFNRRQEPETVSLDAPISGQEESEALTLGDTLPDDTPTAEEIIFRNETVSELNDALAKLPALQRDVIILRYFKGMTPRHIGERCGIATKSVSNALYRGLRNLRVILTGGAA